VFLLESIVRVIFRRGVKFVVVEDEPISVPVTVNYKDAPKHP
jgi:hypothetical protein